SLKSLQAATVAPTTASRVQSLKELPLPLPRRRLERRGSVDSDTSSCSSRSSASSRWSSASEDSLASTLSAMSLSSAGSAVQVPVKKGVRFNETVVVMRTFSASEYDRTPIDTPPLTQADLNDIFQIRREMHLQTMELYANRQAQEAAEIARARGRRGAFASYDGSMLVEEYLKSMAVEAAKQKIKAMASSVETSAAVVGGPVRQPRGPSAGGNFWHVMPAMVSIF
ncbi:hypothetical protein HK102_010921, partial [Quaeritorhiza haematococci]